MTLLVRFGPSGTIRPCWSTDTLIELSVHIGDQVARTSGKSPPLKAKASGRRAFTEGKVRKEFWLDPKALAEAQAHLGTTSERETVEVALDLVAFRRDLAAGARALSGMRLERID